MLRMRDARSRGSGMVAKGFTVHGGQAFCVAQHKTSRGSLPDLHPDQAKAAGAYGSNTQAPHDALQCKYSQDGNKKHKTRQHFTALAGFFNWGG